MFTRFSARSSGSLRISLLMMALSGLCACASSGYQPRVEVRNELSPESKASSYGFLDPLAVEEAGYPPEVVAAFHTEIADRMNELGYRHAAEPDLLINAAADLSGGGGLEGDPYQAIHPQRGTFHDSWRGYGHGFGASHTRSRIEDGRMVVGIIDSDTRELVWEGSVTGRIGGVRETASLIESVKTNLQLMLAELPRAYPADGSTGRP